MTRTTCTGSSTAGSGRRATLCSTFSSSQQATPARPRHFSQLAQVRELERHEWEGKWAEIRERSMETDRVWQGIFADSEESSAGAEAATGEQEGDGEGWWDLVEWDEWEEMSPEGAGAEVDTGEQDGGGRGSAKNVHDLRFVGLAGPWPTTGRNHWHNCADYFGGIRIPQVVYPNPCYNWAEFQTSNPNLHRFRNPYQRDWWLLALWLCSLWFPSAHTPDDSSAHCGHSYIVSISRVHDFGIQPLTRHKSEGV